MNKINTFKIGVIVSFACAVFFACTAFASAATLSVSPTSGSYQTGQTFTISVNLDTQGAAIDGVDVHYLHFNPTLMQALSTTATPGTLMPATMANSINNASGLINFSQIVAGGQHYTGTGTLFTVTFKALSAGTAPITIDYTSGGTTQSDVASVGVNILNSVTNAQLMLSGTTVTGVTVSTGSTGGTSVTTTTTTTSGSTGILSPSGSIIFTMALSTGSTGSQVSALQSYLGVISTGYFGQLTAQAVGKFQVQYGITTVGGPGYGQVGPKTRAELNTLIGGTQTGGYVQTTSVPSSGSTFTSQLSLGTSNAQVSALQAFLAKDSSIYPQGLVTGYYGQLTAQAVGKFQVQYGITTVGGPGYGQVGPKTRAELNTLIGQ